MNMINLSIYLYKLLVLYNTSVMQLSTSMRHAATLVLYPQGLGSCTPIALICLEPFQALLYLRQLPLFFPVIIN